MGRVNGNSSISGTSHGIFHASHDSGAAGGFHGEYLPERGYKYTTGTPYARWRMGFNEAALVGSSRSIEWTDGEVELVHFLHWGVGEL